MLRSRDYFQNIRNGTNTKTVRPPCIVGVATCQTIKLIFDYVSQLYFSVIHHLTPVAVVKTFYL